jgi:hypothetical protein
MAEKWVGAVQMPKGMNVVRMMDLKCIVVIINNMKMNLNTSAVFEILLLVVLHKRFSMPYQLDKDFKLTRQAQRVFNRNLEMFVGMTYDKLWRRQHKIRDKPC